MGRGDGAGGAALHSEALLSLLGDGDTLELRVGDALGFMGDKGLNLLGNLSGDDFCILFHTFSPATRSLHVLMAAPPQPQPSPAALTCLSVPLLFVATVGHSPLVPQRMPLVRPRVELISHLKSHGQRGTQHSDSQMHNTRTRVLRVDIVISFESHFHWVSGAFLTLHRHVTFSRCNEILSTRLSGQICNKQRVRRDQG